MSGDENKGQRASEVAEFNLRSSVEERYKKIREHAETYPYLWASYIVVYGGLGVYLTYRWTKLRRTEARVRVLQERLRKLAEAEEAAHTIDKSQSVGSMDKSQNR
ncbi:uncharacterized protein LOC18441859 [Amborella trichopoda]|uniref:Transmembrane protein n=1 Tax=Amborella trichopoda TaxID=13333 RepID=W1Q0P5_AMBTC|nr:uncharacterized protein LOC18441859 [Amborella trichopoda]ERN13575.1 hypothetical protein AMTR_s00049p00015390 [Amborella trichopoda]|eukprot:XP_011626134.1 uncharacterized protein LOC18441859 [Amborella trichopoda]